ncbi:MAG: FtsX-like permease family protein [Caldilineaceae bacterium]
MGFLLRLALPTLLGDLLPPDVDLAISARNVVEGLLLGVFVLETFTFIPLYQLGDLRPHFIFRKEAIRLDRPLPYIAGRVDPSRLRGHGLLAARRVRHHALLRRHGDGAAAHLRRPHRGDAAPVAPLASAFAAAAPGVAQAVPSAQPQGHHHHAFGQFGRVVLSLPLVEQTLNANFVVNYPEGAQRLLPRYPARSGRRFPRRLGEDVPFFPVVTGTLEEINGEPRRRGSQNNDDGPTDPMQGSQRRNFEFNLTYRDELIDSEGIVAGDTLFDANFTGAQVSVLDEITDWAGVGMGDVLLFRIQGVPLEATVTSVRTRTAEGIEPFFSFVFPSDVLGSAPQSIFTAQRVPVADVPALQNRIVAQFPNVSVLDVTATITTFSGLARRITNVVRFFTVFSIIAGLLIVVSAVFATRFARIQEAAYYKVLGAKGEFVLRVFTLENLLLGLVSALLALGMAQIGSWLINTRLFELEYQPFWAASVTMIGITMLLVTAVGMAASISILRARPIHFLREQAEEE